LEPLLGGSEAAPEAPSSGSRFCRSLSYSETESDEGRKCGICQEVVEENCKLKEENKSLKEIIAVLERFGRT